MKLEIVIALVTSLASIGFYGVLRKFISEVKEIIETYKQAKSDGVITDKEMQDIAKESMEALEQGIKLVYMLKKVFKRK